MITLRQLCIAVGSVPVIIGLNMGIFLWLGIPMGLVKLVCELLAYTAFFLAVKIALSQRLNIVHAFNFIFPILACGFAGFISALNGHEGFLGGVVFVRWVLSYSVLGAAFILIAPTEKEMRPLSKIVIAILLFQPVVAVYKLMTIGISESPWIGTMHQSAGEFGLLLPLIVISFLLPRFLIMEDLKALALIIPFIFFSIVNEKRAAIFMIPAWFFMIYIAYVYVGIKFNKYGFLKTKKISVELFKAVTIIAFMIITVITISSFSPSLNPQEIVGGEVSVKHVTKYTHEYLTRDYDHPLNNPVENVEIDNDIQVGRFRAIFLTWKFMLNQPLEKMLFGLGGGGVNSSHILGSGREDILFKITGIRSPLTTASSILLEAGLFGFAMLCFWFLATSYTIVRMIVSSRSQEILVNYLGLAAFLIVIGFDYFAYSLSIWTASVLSPFLFALLGYELGNWYKTRGKRIVV